jgi:DNA polymerase-3 subunit gamma/tau
MALKGLAEVQSAPQPLSALEMLLIRLAHAADLPSPADLVASLRDGGGASGAGAPAPRGGGGGGARATLVSTAALAAPAAVAGVPSPQAATSAALAPQPASFREVVELFEAKREGILHGLLWNSVHLLRFEPGVIEMRAPGCPRDFPARLMDMLGRWTGRRWMVSLSDQPEGEPTLAQQAASAIAARKARAAGHPLVRRALEVFPGATLERVSGAGEQPAEPVPPVAADVADVEDAPPDYDLIPEHFDPEGDEP